MIEVLKQVLDALETPWNAPYVDGCDLTLGKRVKAIASLRQAIAELESQEPVGEVDAIGLNETDFHVSFKRPMPLGTKLYTHPPQRTEQEPVQVSPLEFVEMVMEKEHLIGKPIFWAEWPNKEKNT
jgi:hypothetical protein